MAQGRRGACLPLLLLLLVLTGQLCVSARPLLLFLFDGFRYDYMDDLDALPGFRELVNNGVKVDYMTPDFPTLSYPNYYSLMTGRHCDIHHMTGNRMWDEASKAEFLIGTNPDSLLPLWWNGSEPLWVTLEKLGKNVFMYYWPGCEVEILGVYPSFCEKYYYQPSQKNLTDSIENALNILRSGQAAMAAIYYEKVDVEGHNFGPDSHQVREAVQELDVAMQKLNSKIKEKEMVDQLNIMMFSDHGMTKIQMDGWQEKVIELDKFINMSDIVKMMDKGPVVSLWPRDNKYQEVYAALSRIPNMRVYAKQDVPERFHFKGGKFVSPLTLIAEPHWFIVENKEKFQISKTVPGKPFAWPNGWHGYDNEFVDMRGFFLATGPDFKRNVRAAPIRAVDVYNMMCSTLGVKPLPNNGSWSRVEYLLNDSGHPSPSRAMTLLTCSSSIFVILQALWNENI